MFKTFHFTKFNCKKRISFGKLFAYNGHIFTAADSMCIYAYEHMRRGVTHLPASTTYVLIIKQFLSHHFTQYKGVTCSQ